MLLLELELAIELEFVVASWGALSLMAKKPCSPLPRVFAIAGAQESGGRRLLE